MPSMLLLERAHNRELALFYDLDTDGRLAELSSLAAELDRAGLVNTEAVPFIKRAEEVLIVAEGTPQQAQIAITRIEKEAIAALSGDALTQFMSYAETAKASLSFWAENYGMLLEKVHGITQNTEGRWSWDWLNPHFWIKVGIAAASDAAGAAAGAALGAGLATMFLGPAAAPVGAKLGATSGAIASSKQAFDTGSFCVVISHEVILKKLR